MIESRRLDIDRGRLLNDLTNLSRIGGRKDGGVDRVGWTEPELRARKWVQRRLAEAGLVSSVDAALNVFGRVSERPARRLLVGSHSDSVSAGGRLDGAYGVVAALEVLRTLAEASNPAAEHVELVDFADEEGIRFQCGYFGSKALVGALDPSDLEKLVDVTGVPVPEVLRASGVEFDELHTASEHLPDVAGFLELHIEQGPRLESGGYSVGFVLGILGVERFRVKISGRSSHGGTTPFDLRQDPCRAAAQFITDIPRLVTGVDAEGVATVGVLSTTGGAINFTASDVEFSLELRQPNRKSLAASASAVRRRLSEICRAYGCSVSITRQDLRPEQKDGIQLAVEPAFIRPAHFHGGMVEATELACSDLHIKHRPMYAGTWHDAGIMSERVPTGMLLVPSRNGLTHTPAEDTSDEDLVNGARALLRATLRAVETLGLISSSAI